MVNHIDLFCGAGGFGLGFKMAGFGHLYAIDMDKNAVKTYNENIGGAECGRIEDVDDATWFEMRDKVDVITAGFPCQPFSVAGKQKGWTDGRADFYDSLLDIVFNTKAKFVIFENVKRFVTHDGGNSIKRLIGHMETMGYIVKYKILNSNNYDVPQKRERVIIVCNNIGVDYEFPEESDWKPVLGDFILNLPESDGFEFTPEKAKQFLMIPEGGNWNDFPTEEIKKWAMKGSYKSSGGKTGYFKRLKMSEPSNTLLGNPNSKMTPKVHPWENRWLNVKEYAVIQTFPTDYEFVGSLSSQYKQIGNAVPVNMAYHIAQSLKGYLE